MHLSITPSTLFASHLEQVPEILASDPLGEDGARWRAQEQTKVTEGREARFREAREGDEEGKSSARAKEKKESRADATESRRGAV